MSEVPYSNRELREKWDGIEASLMKILEQTSITNGRVTKLEHWQSMVLGYCACLTMLVLPLIIYVYGLK